MSVRPFVRQEVAPHPVSGAQHPHDPIASLLLYLPLVAVTFAAKFAIPFGDKQVPIPLIVLGGTVAFGFLSGRLRIIPAALAYYLLTLTGLGILQLIGADSFSYLSLLLVAVIHIPLVINLEPGLISPKRGPAVFQNVAAIIGLGGILQYAGQFVIGFDFTFPIENLTPVSLIVRNYHYLNPLYYGSSFFKSNGIFLLEPSFFSQLSAISLVVELIYFRRVSRVVILAFALVVAYSGTGLVIVAVVVPPLLISQRRLDLVLILATASALLIAAAGMLNLGIFAARLGEFGSTSSSAFARFVNEFSLFDQFLWPDFKNAMIGIGAGATDELVRKANLPTAQMTFTKIVLEYGILGSLLYGSFFVFCLFRPKGQGLIKVALLIGFLMNGALVPWITGLAASLLIWPSRTDGDDQQIGSLPRRPLL